MVIGKNGIGVSNGKNGIDISNRGGLSRVKIFFVYIRHSTTSAMWNYWID